MLKVVILGHGAMLANLIAGVMDSGCEIVGVMRYDRLRKSNLKTWFHDYFLPSKEFSYIKSYKLHEIRAKSANSKIFKREILRLNADIIIVGTWGEKLTKATIDLPKIATINVHPSLLPKYRGPNPYLQVIKNLETKTGLTFHLMDEKYDCGPILMQKEIEIEGTDTGKELKDKAVLTARGGICELLCNLLEEIIIPIPQISEAATYYPQIKDNEIMLDFKQPAKNVAAHIRAFHPWHKCYFAYKNVFFAPNPYKLKVIDANEKNATCGEIIAKSSTHRSITVMCADGKALEMSGLNLYGKFKKWLTVFYIKSLIKISDKVE